MHYFSTMFVTTVLDIGLEDTVCKVTFEEL